MKRINDLTQGPIAAKLARLTIPMVFGMFSMVIFNLVDTFFVARLGTNELAAMGFTFPVVMFFIGITLGLGVATASVVSQAIGRGDTHQVKQFTTHSLIISVVIVSLFAVLGLLSMNKVFGLLGANQEITALVTDYMRVWYVGVVFVVVPMVGNNAIRACGDTLYPSLIMIISTLINIILDPLLIFGLAGFPRLELAGAALATVIARAFAFLLSLLILHFREKLIDFSLPKLKEVVDSCKKILYLGLPAAASRILLPLAVAIIMRLVAGFGPKAVAAVGAAVRIEMFVFMVIMALATALVPFAGQNWGAKKLDRLKLATSYSNTFSLVWGFLSFIFLLIFAGPLGRVFSKDPVVSQSITYYLWIMPLGYGLRSISMLTASLFNAINRPFASSALNITRMFFLYIPLAYFGSLWFGLSGLFFGLLLANILSGLIALRWQKALI